MATFEDYLNRLPSGPQATPSSSRGLDFSGAANLPTGTPLLGKNEMTGEQSPLNWFIDILSRPLYGTTNYAKGVIDDTTRAVQRASGGDYLGALGEVIKPINTRFIEGVFSNDPEAKNTTSDLIEYGTDEVGRLRDNNYVDRENNVNPVLKGVAGFAGDVALDPLTWIPGGIIAKGVKGAVKGGAEVAQKAAEAAGKVRTGTKAAEAADDVVRTTDSAIDATAKTPEQAVAHARVNRNMDVPNTTGQTAKAGTLVDTLDEGVPAPAQVSIVDALQRAEGVNEAPAVQGADLPAGAVPETRAQTVPAREDLTGSAKVAESADEIAEKRPETVIDLVKEISKKAPTLGPKSTFQTVEEAIVAAPESSRLSTFLDQLAVDAKTKQVRVDGMGRGEALPVADILTAFQARKAADREFTDFALGKPLVDYLSRVTTPKQFEKVVDDLKRALRADEASFAGTYNAASDPSVLDAMLESLKIPVRSADAGTPQKVEEVLAAGESTLSSEKKILQEWARAELVDMAENAPYRTATGVARTAQEIGVGTGKRLRELNTFSNFGLFKTIWNGYIKKGGRHYDEYAAWVRERGLDPKKLYGKRRSETVRDFVLERYQNIDSMMDDLGIRVTLNLGSDAATAMGIRQEPIYLSYGDVLSILQKHDNGSLQYALWNAGSAAAPTNVMLAVSQRISGAEREALLETLGTDKKFGTKGWLETEDATLPNNLGKKTVRGYHHPKTGWQEMDGAKLRGQFADVIEAASDDLVRASNYNAAAYRARVGKETYELSTEQLQKIEEFIANPATLDDGLRAVAKTPEQIADVADGKLQDSVNAATIVTEASVGKPVSQTAKRIVKQDGSVQNAATATKAQKAVDDATDGVAKDIDDELEDLLSNAPHEARMGGIEASWQAQRLDLSSTYTFPTMQEGVLRFLDPAGKFRQTFVQGHGMERLNGLRQATQNIGGRFVQEQQRDLNKIARQFGARTSDQIVESPIPQAFRDLQRGIVNADPRVAGASRELGRVLDRIFSTQRPSLLNNSFFRNASDAEYLNTMFRASGLGDLFDIPAAVNATRGQKQGALQNALAEQWRTWDVKDPVDFLSRLSNAAAQVAEHRAIVGSFHRMAVKNGLASQTPKPGYVKITSGGDTKFGQFLRPDWYYEKSVASELHRAEKSMSESRRVQNDLVKKYYVPTLDAWKFAITLPRPGHHIRNFIGDSSITFVARGVRDYTRSTKDAWRVLATRNSYDGVDVARALERIGDTELPTGGTVISSGNYGDLTTEGIWQAALERGLFPSFRQGEGLFDDALQETGYSRALDKLTLRETVVGRTAGDFSEFRDHYSRLQHFIQVIHQEQRKRGFKSLDEMLDAAGSEVRKYHPDASMLSTFESRYMRLIIPFYSWFRGILPAIFESTMRNPGRVSVFPKASYNLAVSMGINPESLSDPFPEDQIFPSFLTEQATGPQFQVDGNYLGLNPGIAHLDVFNELGTDPIRNIAGMTTPLVRVPLELLSGGSWSTGSPIRDNSEYIDSSIPGVNYLSNLLGISTTGTVGNVLSGDVSVDPQRQVESGNKTDFDKGLTALNWLTGLGLSNMSRPSFINYAEIENRNRAAEER
jgi:hypothetical protein